MDGHSTCQLVVSRAQHLRSPDATEAHSGMQEGAGEVKADHHSLAWR